MRLIDADREIERYTRDYLWPTPDVHEFEKRNAIIIVNALRQMPTAESRPKGEWIDGSDEGYVECPFCHSATTCEDNIEELHFCWNCGAELRADMGGTE